MRVHVYHVNQFLECSISHWPWHVKCTFNSGVDKVLTTHNHLCMSCRKATASNLPYLIPTPFCWEGGQEEANSPTSGHAPHVFRTTYLHISSFLIWKQWDRCGVCLALPKHINRELLVNAAKLLGWEGGLIYTGKGWGGCGNTSIVRTVRHWNLLELAELLLCTV